MTEERDATRASYDELRKKRLDEFMAGFDVISLKLKEMYQMITLGGDAELELVDSLDPFSEGIVFSVRPPKKSWKNIANLSGGEKTLSSLALVFALHHYKPTPLYVMDEIAAEGTPRTARRDPAARRACDRRRARMRDATTRAPRPGRPPRGGVVVVMTPSPVIDEQSENHCHMKPGDSSGHIHKKPGGPGAGSLVGIPDLRWISSRRYVLVGI